MASRHPALFSSVSIHEQYAREGHPSVATVASVSVSGGQQPRDLNRLPGRSTRRGPDAPGLQDLGNADQGFDARSANVLDHDLVVALALARRAVLAALALAAVSALPAVPSLVPRALAAASAARVRSLIGRASSSA